MKALVEPLSVGWHGVRIASDIHPDTMALVIGAGPVGCAVVLALVARGVKQIIVSDISEARTSIAQSLGATKSLNPRLVPVAERIVELTRSEGIDAVFDCAGVSESIDTATRVVAPFGKIINLAIWSTPMTFDANLLLHKEAAWFTSLAYTATDFQEVIDALASGAMDPSRMITNKIALEDIVEKGFEALHANNGAHCKVLVDLQM